MEQTVMTKREGMKDAMPLRRWLYPEYARPTAGMIGQQKTVQTRTKAWRGSQPPDLEKQHKAPPQNPSLTAFHVM